MFWEKVVQTVAFEHFIQCEGYLDDSNTRVFKNILKKESNDNSLLNDGYSFSINMPYHNMGRLFKDINSYIIL